MSDKNKSEPFNNQKTEIFNYQELDEISQIINKFGRYGESFFKFAEEFYNYKISYNLVFEHLKSITDILKTARPELPQTMQGYISSGQYQNFGDIEQFIKILEANIKYMAFNTVKIADENTPEKTSYLIKGISKEDMYGFPHGWNNYIKDEFRGYGFYNLKNNNDSEVINWDAFFAKLLHFDINKMKKVTDKIRLEVGMYSENPPVNGFYFEGKEPEKYRKTCEHVFFNAPKTAMEQLHKTETMFFENGCSDRLTYLSYRYYLNTMMRYLVENTPNAYQIRNGDKQESLKKPTKISALKNMKYDLEKLPSENYDESAKSESLAVCEVALDTMNLGLPIERVPFYLKNGPNIAFTSLHLTRKSQQNDIAIFKRILEKRSKSI